MLAHVAAGVNTTTTTFLVSNTTGGLRSDTRRLFIVALSNPIINNKYKGSYVRGSFVKM